MSNTEMVGLDDALYKLGQKSVFVAKIASRRHEAEIRAQKNEENSPWKERIGLRLVKYASWGAGISSGAVGFLSIQSWMSAVDYNAHLATIGSDSEPTYALQKISMAGVAIGLGIILGLVGNHYKHKIEAIRGDEDYTIATLSSEEQRISARLSVVNEFLQSSKTNKMDRWLIEKQIEPENVPKLEAAIMYSNFGIRELLAIRHIDSNLFNSLSMLIEKGYQAKVANNFCVDEEEWSKSYQLPSIDLSGAVKKVEAAILKQEMDAKMLRARAKAQEARRKISRTYTFRGDDGIKPDSKPTTRIISQEKSKLGTDAEVRRDITPPYRLTEAPRNGVPRRSAGENYRRWVDTIDNPLTTPDSDSPYSDTFVRPVTTPTTPRVLYSEDISPIIETFIDGEAGRQRAGDEDRRRRAEETFLRNIIRSQSDPSIDVYGGIPGLGKSAIEPNPLIGDDGRPRSGKK